MVLGARGPKYWVLGPAEFSEPKTLLGRGPRDGSDKRGKRTPVEARCRELPCRFPLKGSFKGDIDIGPFKSYIWLSWNYSMGPELL